ncbi:MAG: hypothetical protein H6Q71_1471 [Firmicutes bacterium]|nr:hypothetical protein [Bacillota bacterium]
MKPFQYTQHKALWNWLADNPDKRKQQWPGWQCYAMGDCFACEYDYLLGDSCINCPLVWPGKFCNGDSNGLFIKWSRTNDLQKRSELAKQIANLPVKDGVEYI